MQIAYQQPWQFIIIYITYKNDVVYNTAVHTIIIIIALSLVST